MRASLILVFASCGVICGPASAEIIINPTYNDAPFVADGIDPTLVHNAFNYVIQEYESLFSNPIDINITVQAGNTGLGSSNTSLVGFMNYTQTRDTLIADCNADPNAACQRADASLPVAEPTSGGSFVFSTAEAKALGLIPNNTTTDGTFTFNGTLQYTFDPSNRQVAGEYDFIGIAEHEVSEIMGRIPVLGANFGNGLSYDVNDLFRFTAPGVRSLNQTDQNVYLSINDGVTNLVNFNPPNGGDLDDYKGDNSTDPYNAFTGRDQGHQLNSVDLTNMEILGYATTVPEPSTILLAASALAGLWIFRRRTGHAHAMRRPCSPPRP